jgi:hypothetical protein
MCKLVAKSAFPGSGKAVPFAAERVSKIADAGLIVATAKDPHEWQLSDRALSKADLMYKLKQPLQVFAVREDFDEGRH